MREPYDLLVIGGGINGTAVARDAAGRGLSVCLCEKDDLANHTSSSSTKLIHGGLRYLEQYEFKLVRESLIEREVLLRAAPHIIWPMRFVLPYDKGLRPKWMLRAGLFLYDTLGGRKMLPGTRTVKLKGNPAHAALETRLKTGFEYSDCWVEDARLVVLNAVDAARRGADIFTRTAVASIAIKDGLYEAVLERADTTQIVRARGVINAAGPWVEQVLRKIEIGRNESELRLVKGSHIITRKLYDGDHAYIFQNADNRVIFAIPYEGDYTLIGTTDVPYKRIDWKVEISPDEINYLCSAVSEYFTQDVTPQDVVWTYSGVRPLYDDHNKNASAVTRDYVLDIDLYADERPFMSVYGGKITTSRKLAEHALEKLEDYYPDAGEPWTKDAPLPGGDIEGADFGALLETYTKQYPAMDDTLRRRLARAYGTRFPEVVNGGDLGRHFGAGLHESEARFLMNHEWATTADDIMWRRTKLGLHMSGPERDSFTAWFDSRP